MTVLEFIVSILDAVAWPLAVVVLGIIFRNELTGLLRHLAKVKAPGGFEAEFREQLVEITRRAEQLPLPPKTALDDVGTTSPTDAVRHPHLAVLEAWRTVDDQLRATAADLGVDRTAPVSVLLKTISDRDRLDPHNVKLVRDMQRVRNAVAHGEVHIEPESAAAYASAAAKVRSVLAGDDLGIE